MIKFLILFLIPHYLFASALIYKNEKNNELQLISRLHIWGPYATPELAEAIHHEIETMWNEPEAYYQIGDKEYRVRFVIDYKYYGKKEPAVSPSCANNTIEIRRAFSSDQISGYLSSRGIFYTKDDLGNSTTAAHEFGHGLGLDHPHGSDQKEADVPGIMFARNTAVKQEFQWNPAVRAGAIGGALNPKYRKVRVEDVLDIPINKAFLFNNYGCIGKGNPIPLKD